MPGPGGESRGGGGSRGGFSGGGSRGGGGHRGGYRGGYHRGGYYGGYYGPRRRYYGGSGCLGSLLAMFLIPICILFVAVVLIFASIASAFTTIAKGGETVFNSSKIVDYGKEKYAEIYNPDREGYEDNLLIVLLVETDEYYDYSFVGIVGNHIDSQVVDLFGNEETALGRAIYSAMPDDYEHSLTLNLKSVVSSMTKSVKSANPTKDFDCSENHNLSDSKFYNYSAIPVDEETLNTVLAKFTNETGITISLVIDEQVDVYGKTISASTIIFGLIGVGLIVLAIILIVNTVKNSKKNNNGGGHQNGGYNNGGNSGNYQGGPSERININDLF